MSTKFANLLTLFLGLISGSFVQAQFERPCTHDIYCDGPLLHTVQMAGVFNDSKTFVDCPMRYSTSQILGNFALFMEYHNNTPSVEDVKVFVDYNFEPAGNEMESWFPEDWTPAPSFLNDIADLQLKQFGLDLHNFWEKLGRQMNPEVCANPDKYTLVCVPNPVIVPGGRFREFYYWDSYWIQMGLLKSQMADTVRGMIENFGHMADTLGFVPNGGRIYYQRSQPPLLIPMVKNYHSATQNLTFLEQILPTLDKEFSFWETKRSISIDHPNGKSYTMFRYNSERNGPRPESYKEDYNLAEGYTDEDARNELYSALHSGAESGIDFSSRWFDKTLRAADLIYTSTRAFLPADLNAYLYYNAKLMAEFHLLLGNTANATRYQEFADNLKIAINEVLWDDDLGCWFDYNHIKKELHKEFFPTNIVPLWAGAEGSPQVIDRVLAYLESSGALGYPGGIPSSLTDSGEQWDFPNAWAPLVDLVIEGLDRSGNADAQAKAFELAQTWISTNYIAFYNSDPNHMYEKYNVTALGLPGGGGEYEIVIGFGWSNGVVINFLSKYGDRLVAPSLPPIQTDAPTTEQAVTTPPAGDIDEPTTQEPEVTTSSSPKVSSATSATFLVVVAILFSSAML